MTSPEDPFTLLAMLKQQYGVDESDSMLGPSVVVPNQAMKREWALCLEKAGIHMYAGEKASRVAWFIPLKGRLIYPANAKDPRSNEAPQPTSIPRGSQDQAPSRGCITGRPWTQQEDQQLLAMLSQGKPAQEIARLLSERLDRTERAIKDRVKKLRQRQKAGTQTPLPEEARPEASQADKAPPGFEPGPAELHSLLESALLLAGDPKHRPALRLILEACLRHASQNHPQQPGNG